MRLGVILVLFLVISGFTSSALAVELSVGLADYWGNFTLGFQDYEVTFEAEGICLLGFNTEVRFVDNKLGLGLNYVNGVYAFEGSGTTKDDEEIEAEGDRTRTDLDVWVRYAPSSHFSIFAGYKKLEFDFDDVYAFWTAPPAEYGKELHGTADVDMDGFAIGLQTAFGRRVIGVISFAYFPALSGNVSWDGYTQKPGEPREPDVGESTIDSQGFRFVFNVVKA